MVLNDTGPRTTVLENMGGGAPKLFWKLKNRKGEMLPALRTNGFREKIFEVFPNELKNVFKIALTRKKS